MYCKKVCKLVFYCGLVFGSLGYIASSFADEGLGDADQKKIAENEQDCDGHLTKQEDVVNYGTCPNNNSDVFSSYSYAQDTKGPSIRENIQDNCTGTGNANDNTTHIQQPTLYEVVQCFEETFSENIPTKEILFINALAEVGIITLFKICPWQKVEQLGQTINSLKNTHPICGSGIRDVAKFLMTFIHYYNGTIKDYKGRKVNGYDFFNALVRALGKGGTYIFLMNLAPQDNLPVNHVLLSFYTVEGIGRIGLAMEREQGEMPKVITSIIAQTGTGLVAAPFTGKNFNMIAELIINAGGFINQLVFNNNLPVMIPAFGKFGVDCAKTMGISMILIPLTKSTGETSAKYLAPTQALILCTIPFGDTFVPVLNKLGGRGLTYSVSGGLILLASYYNNNDKEKSWCYLGVKTAVTGSLMAANPFTKPLLVMGYYFVGVAADSFIDNNIEKFCNYITSFALIHN